MRLACLIGAVVAVMALAQRWGRTTAEFARAVTAEQTAVA